jgi:hypothetical protein
VGKSPPAARLTNWLILAVGLEALLLLGAFQIVWERVRDFLGGTKREGHDESVKISPANNSPVDKFLKEEQTSQFGAFYDSAEGSHIQRSCVAAARYEIESEYMRVMRECLSSRDQTIFMMAYSCFVLWRLKRGLEEELGPDEVESALVVMRWLFSKQAWYQQEPFDSIWFHLQRRMPLAVQVKEGQMPYPDLAIEQAAQSAGYPLTLPIRLDRQKEFSCFIYGELRLLVGFGQKVAEQHLQITRGGSLVGQEV